MAVFEKLRVLHGEIDRDVQRLENSHKDRLKCKESCHDCCVDSITVFELEANRIREDFPQVLTEEVPHAPGKCAFLDTQGSCRIYTARPYVCRTQGLPLRWTEDEFEYRDICALNEEGSPLVELPEEECWTLGPYEGRLATEQSNGNRVSLRSLFSKEHK